MKLYFVYMIDYGHYTGRAMTPYYGLSIDTKNKRYTFDWFKPSPCYPSKFLSEKLTTAADIFDMIKCLNNIGYNRVFFDLN